MARPLYARPGALAAYQAVQQGYITIKSLCQRSGVHKQTIHYYLRKRLLPAPVRTSKTSALYPPSTIDLLRLVKNYQDQRRYTLDEIAEIFRRVDYDPQVIRRELESSDLPPVAAAAEAGRRWLAAEELLSALDPPPPREWLDEVIQAGLLDAQTRGGRLVFSPASLVLAKNIWEGKRLGASLTQFKAHAEFLEAQADQELKRFLDLLRDIPLANDAYPQVARLFHVFERVGAYRRKSALHAKFIGGSHQPSRHQFVTPNRKYVFPSETFLAKMGLNQEIDRLLLRLETKPRDLDTLRSLMRAYNLRSDWARLYESAQEVLRLVPNDEIALANLGQALGYLGRLDESVALLEQSLKRFSNPLLKIRLGESLVFLARRTGDAAQLFDAIVKQARLASQAVKESQHSPSLHRKIRLILALDNMSLSDPLGLQGPSVEDLERLYREFHAPPDRPLSVLSKISLTMGRLFATYALYLVRLRLNHPEAERLRREIVSADPSGILAARTSRMASRAKPPSARRTDP